MCIDVTFGCFKTKEFPLQKYSLWHRLYFTWLYLGIGRTSFCPLPLFQGDLAIAIRKEQSLSCILHCWWFDHIYSFKSRSALQRVLNLSKVSYPCLCLESFAWGKFTYFQHQHILYVIDPQINSVLKIQLQTIIYFRRGTQFTILHRSL